MPLFCGIYSAGFWEFTRKHLSLSASLGKLNNRSRPELKGRDLYPIRNLPTSWTGFSYPIRSESELDSFNDSAVAYQDALTYHCLVGYLFFCYALSAENVE